MSLGGYPMKVEFFCACSVILSLLLGTSDRAAAQGPKDNATAYRGGLVTPPLAKPRFTLSTT